jgi:hypothetical protein
VLEGQKKGLVSDRPKRRYEVATELHSVAYFVRVKSGVLQLVDFQ